MKLLTTKEAAALLGVSPRTMQAWRYQGKGPKFVRLSHKNVRYDNSELTKWIESKGNE